MKKKYFLLLFAIMFLSAHVTYARYVQPHKKDNYISNNVNIHEMIIVIVTWIKFFINAWIIYHLIWLVIATILYITSGGNEDRMDMAIKLYKRSILLLIFAPIMYFCVVYAQSIFFA